jgi:hypothetical protein
MPQPNVHSQALSLASQAYRHSFGQYCTCRWPVAMWTDAMKIWQWVSKQQTLCGKQQSILLNNEPKVTSLLLLEDTIICKDFHLLFSFPKKKDLTIVRALTDRGVWYLCSWLPIFWQHIESAARLVSIIGLPHWVRGDMTGGEGHL